MSRTEFLAGKCNSHIEWGSALSVLLEMPSACVDMCVTSPPYYMLRDYGCGPGEIGHEPVPDCNGWAKGTNCCQCYVCTLVTVFAEVKRVLKPTGTLWLNLGDSYNGSGATGGDGKQRSNQGSLSKPDLRSGIPSIPQKSLLLLPSRVALALQTDGWILRNAVTWAKKSPFPSPVEDRMTNATEMVYLFAKSPSYFYDQVAERIPLAEASLRDKRFGRKRERNYEEANKRYGTGSACRPLAGNAFGNQDGRNLWDYWVDLPDGEPPVLYRAKGDLPDEVLTHLEQVGPQGNPDFWLMGNEPQKHKHYAAFPSLLPSRAIRLGTSERGNCQDCGAPWLRIYGKEKLTRERPRQYVKRTGKAGTGNACANTVAGSRIITVGWLPSCGCGGQKPALPIKPESDATPEEWQDWRDRVALLCKNYAHLKSDAACVLDPFCGSGATGIVAIKEGRRFFGIDLSEKFCNLARSRLTDSVGLFA